MCDNESHGDGDDEYFLEALPRELLAEVLGLLNWSPAAVCACRLVCSTWRTWIDQDLAPRGLFTLRWRRGSANPPSLEGLPRRVGLRVVGWLPSKADLAAHPVDLVDYSGGASPHLTTRIVGSEAPLLGVVIKCNDYMSREIAGRPIYDALRNFTAPTNALSWFVPRPLPWRRAALYDPPGGGRAAVPPRKAKPPQPRGAPKPTLKEQKRAWKAAR